MNHIDRFLFRIARDFDVTDAEWHTLLRWFRQSCPDTPAALFEMNGGES